MTVVFALQLIVGFSTSVTVTVNEHAALFPLPSTALKETVVVPTAKTEPLAPPAVCVTTGVPQLSLLDAPRKLTAAPHRPASLPTEIFAGQLIDGGVTSADAETVKLPLPLQPKASNTWKVCTPAAKPENTGFDVKAPPSTRNV